MVHAKKPTIKPSAHRASNAKAFVIQAKSSSIELSCPACVGAPHSLFQCSTFKSWNQERRHCLVKSFVTITIGVNPGDKPDN